MDRCIKWFTMCLTVLLLGIFSTETMAMNVEFHGYVDVNAILRDTDGLEYGFGDQFELIQQRNVLKFDVDLFLKYQMGPISIDKVHITYRGAWDNIFDWRSDEYRGIPDKIGDSRFENGRDDIKWENDLREIFVDITYQGPLGSAFLRPGRQLVSWGEASVANFVDFINPSDVKHMNAANPDDLKTPVYMARLNYSIPPQPSFNLNFDFLVIPDIRPLSFAPLDASMNAPYIRSTAFTAFGALYQLAPVTGFGDIVHDVPTHRCEYAAKMTADIGANLSTSVIFESVAHDAPAVELDLNAALQLPQGARLTHPFTQTLGGTANYYVNPPIDIVIRAEGGYTNDEPIAGPGDTLEDLSLNADGSITVRQYRPKDTYGFAVAIDKNFWARWLSPDKMVGWGIQWSRKYIRDLDKDMQGSNKAQTNWILTTFNLYYWHGKINPFFMLVYDTEGCFMSNVSCTYTISKHWKAAASLLSYWGNNEGISQFAGSQQAKGVHDSGDQLALTLTFQW